MSFEHEHLRVARGPRSGLPIAVAVHSTRLGPALGGCRLWEYPSWEDGIRDVLRLAAAMTVKCAVAGLPTGGGKSVIAVPPGHRLDAGRRRAALLDLGDLVDSLGGRYRTAEDVGTSTADMAVVRERTPHVLGLAGEPAEATARGVFAALEATVERVAAGTGLAGLRFAVSGLGQVGSRLARMLAARGARVTATDVDPAKQAVAAEVGARWAGPREVLTAPTDVFVPAGVGGLLTAEVIAGLRCRAVVGPANNQLATDDADLRLAERGILWAPDFVANAGGALYAILREGDGVDADTLDARVRGIGDTVAELFARAERDGTTPLAAARALAAERLGTEPAVAAQAV
ncbi:Glu/Leu/Phe/Val dehydrogenase dimerization domain-containing protein [Amycolatopsis thermoflava]|uniref:Glu/Leu/Phe/Val dehydrogenase dimerization domain-containing protein n=1 Tax=Amycolatopsis thermoflava TaxID=84480 RepID=UPI00364F7BA7